MALTDKKREALKLARERIDTGENRNICFVLHDVGKLFPHLGPACDQLRAYIRDQLRPWSTFEEWQAANGCGGRSFAQRQIDRTAWIDWMLDEPKEA
ncbi:hypothetical protein [Burkholderia multivorans]|uniref:hypothetical protein n=1 Tax=Burkholderia multivorans TaxID=87883 RepID=UPI0009E0D7A7|nr:hypothetical protein [Burkholderia multivorans]SAJ89216.1 hypothetical protein UA11_04050 [Burkholderia multivorans]